MAIPTIGPRFEPVTFQAAWPKHLDPAFQPLAMKVAKVFWKILSVIVFPIILGKLLLHRIQQFLYKVLIMPGSPSWTYPQSGNQLLQRGKRITLETPDNIKLDGVFFESTQRNAPQKAILYTFGNGGQWEMCENSINWLRNRFPEVSFLLINPRGIGNSEGVRSVDGHALDVYTSYEYLRSEGYPLKNTLLFGQSLGAAYGSMGAAHVQREYPHEPVSMIHDRSFSTFTKEAQALLPKISPALGNFVKKFPSIIRILGLEMNCVEAFASLKGKRCVIYSQSDQIIPYEASMFQANVAGNFIKMESIGQDHNRFFTENEELQVIDFVKKTLDLTIPAAI